VPVAFIDWDTAAPGPRAQNLGLDAWHWVPFCRDEKSRAIGLPTGIADKRSRLIRVAGLGVPEQKRMLVQRVFWNRHARNHGYGRLPLSAHDRRQPGPGLHLELRE
jgi:hypothetical protein